MSALDQIKKNTVIVADTGDINLIKELKPQDATTNPSLILQVASNPAYEHIVDHCIASALSKPVDEQLEYAMDLLLVTFGAEIVKVLPSDGYISSEVDARLSFDKDATIKRAKKVIALYEAEGVSRSRILIKIASTWEGIQAAKELEAEGITCNLTLLFSKAQAIACAQANVKLISPFVGRILDYFKAKGQEFTPEQDPGVIFVTDVWKMYKTYGYNTIVMGASFRNIDEIIELNGCDRLTISPTLLKQLQDTQRELPLKLSKDTITVSEKPLPILTEAQFRWMFNTDPMAVEKLASGIVAFANDIEKLEKIIQTKFDARK